MRKPLRGLVLLLAVGLGSLGTGAARADTGDVLYVREAGAALHSAPDPNAPVALRVSRSYRLTELDRQGAWIRVEPYNVRLVSTEAWVRDSLVGPRPVDVAPSPKPPRPDQGGTVGRIGGDCELRLREDGSLAFARDSGCPVVVVINRPVRGGFAFFNAMPRPSAPQSSTRRPASGGVVPPFSTSPVPPFANSPVPSLVPSR